MYKLNEQMEQEDVLMNSLPDTGIRLSIMEKSRVLEECVLKKCCKKYKKGKRCKKCPDR